MKDTFLKLLAHPYPLRRSVAIRLIRRLQLGSYQQRLALGAVDRPHYGYCVYNAAVLAKKLGYHTISVVEFGVAGGAGLLNLEYHVKEISRLLSIDIDVYGFDSGEGLPHPLDYRDLPYHWGKGFFKIDTEELMPKLKCAKLILGDIRHTGNSFFQEHSPAPIGAVMHDFDFYSSTAAALTMFDADDKYYLPRVYCYFDDTLGGETELYNDYTGERLAINEFNKTHEFKKLTVAYHLLSRPFVQRWYHQIWIYHNFEHTLYNNFISEKDQQLRLNSTV